MTDKEKILVDARRMMQREAWIRNVARVYNIPRSDAEKLHQRIIDDELIRLPLERPGVPGNTNERAVSVSADDSSKNRSK